MDLIKYSLIIALLWSITPILHKYVLNYNDPFIVILISSLFYAGCTIIYSCVYWKRIKNELKEVDKKTIIILGISSIFTVFLANIILTYLTKYNKSFSVTALTFSAPLFTTLWAYLFLHEEISLTSLIGVLLIVIGIIILAYNESTLFLVQRD